ncbi:transcription factor GTE8-like isoform X2 [Hordeum vulgare subsp. vulgare]|uniref:transcription factor GTE8-like isoform X2 n=1 Tax=Hordeum vulgare subsp. vulgare TaxID=112509 RepID=UPI001D1A43D1|nr:transcription factor GTE8-like isoform X2 [Hordeum vulgare subsp. vulgare]
MMGKTQKFSKGHPLGFVPDYRYGVETVGVSKGLGNPVRSEAKRKCLNLNTDEGADAPGFNVPRVVFELPRMSASDRNELEMRLRDELEQVRALQSRLFSRGATTSMNGGAASAPRGDFNGNKKDGKLRRSNSVQSGRGLPPSIAQPVVSSINYTAWFKKCQELLKNLMKHRSASPFVTPVDPVKLCIPDYFDIVKHPMDLGTIQKKLNAGVYPTPWEFAADVRLTFSNAILYNPVGNAVNIMAQTMSSVFEPRWKPIEKKLPRPDEEPSAIERPKNDAVEKNIIENKEPTDRRPSNKGTYKKNTFQKEEVVAKPVLHPKKRKASPLVQDPPVASVVQMAQVAEEVPVVETAVGMMTDEQKVALSVRLQSYGGFIPEHVVEFIKRHVNDDNDADEDELTIDMNALSDDTLFELEKLLDDYDRVNQSGNPTKDEPHEVEFQSEYGLANSSMHHEGHELVEEDIDIGGNDLPPLTYPPVVFESEMADRSSKHSSSSSSSSESGSSSSDSQDTLQEQCAERVPISADDEEENVSDKKYRAALLKSRFADTILKAREKALDQVKDPEKVRREREELERLQREERARLQAEAKAAEEARKRAEAAAVAEAAAEAKRQREREREAARKALQQMEKTVEINEGNLFLKDFEMLGTVTGEQNLNLVGEMSPSHTPEPLGFQLGGNPLEQLGLYMKNDDEEDEEVESADEPTVDVEEGEID